MTQSTSEHVIDYRDVFAPVARRWKLVVGVTALTTAALGAVGVLQPPAYTASSTLTVSPITLDPLSSSSNSQAVNITTEREVLASTEVARIAAQQLGDVSAATLDRSSTVEAPSGSQVLQVSATAGSPEDAAAWANALANAYLTFRGDGAEELAKARLDYVNTRIAEAEESGGGAALADLRSQALALSQIGANPGRLIGLAEPPTSPSSLGASVFLLAGLLGGGLLGALGAIVADRTDRRVRFSATLSRLSGTAVLEVPRGESEALRWLHREIRASSPGTRTRPLVVAAFAVDPADSGELVSGLAQMASELDSRAIVLGSAELPAERLDRPWRYQSAKGDALALVLVDSRHISSPAQKANLAEGADIVLLAASASSSKSDAVQLLEVLRAAGTPRVIPVFTDPRSPETITVGTRSRVPFLSGAGFRAPRAELSVRTDAQ